MDARSLVRSLSAIIAIIAAFMAACMIAGLLMGEGIPALKAFALPMAIGAAALFPALLGGKKRGRTFLSHKAGYLFVVLSWILSSALGAIPFVISGAAPTFVHAFFETMSGFTTTGASVIADLESLPRSILLWRATTHWIGGMGIVVLTVAILPLLGLNARTLMEAEAPGPQVEKFSPRLSDTAKILWLIYAGLTALQTILLMVGGMDWLDALTHSFATMATGGFSTRNASVGAYGSAYIDTVITVFMVLAGMNFSLHWRLLRGEIRNVFKDSELRLYLFLFAAASLAIALDLHFRGGFPSFGRALRFGSFQAASILTTTGFVTADYLLWPGLSQAVLFALMFFGGCSGSTGGGVKVGRLLTMFKTGLSEMRYLLNPRGIHGVYVNGSYLKKNVVYDIAAMVFLYAASIIVSTVVVAAGGFDVMTSLTATLATLGNIGPGFGLAGPACTYGPFPEWILSWLSFMMILGRLEVYTVLVLFTRSFWKS